jgi:hypothetical protein
MTRKDERHFSIGYNLFWRVIFFVFAICMLVASIGLLIQSLLGSSEGLVVPSSILVAAIFLSVYLLPLLGTRRQVLAIAPDGLELIGHYSRVVVPWRAVARVRFRRVMLIMPYLIVTLSDNQPFAQFIDENPRSFLSKWAAHVAVFRWYPWVLRRLFSVPKQMTTVAILGWLDKRYGGSIVIDAAALNGRGRALEGAIRAHIKTLAADASSTAQ